MSHGHRPGNCHPRLVPLPLLLGRNVSPNFAGRVSRRSSVPSASPRRGCPVASPCRRGHAGRRRPLRAAAGVRQRGAVPRQPGGDGGRDLGAGTQAFANFAHLNVAGKNYSPPLPPQKKRRPEFLSTPRCVPLWAGRDPPGLKENSVAHTLLCISSQNSNSCNVTYDNVIFPKSCKPRKKALNTVKIT